MGYPRVQGEQVASLGEWREEFEQTSCQMLGAGWGAVRDQFQGSWLRQALLDGLAPLIDPVPVEVSAGRAWAGG
jgi:hypothetical protein